MRGAQFWNTDQLKVLADCQCILHPTIIFPSKYQNILEGKCDIFVNINITVQIFVFWCWTFVTQFSCINLLITQHWFLFLMFSNKSLIILRIKNEKTLIWYCNVYFSVGYFLRNGKTPLFLIAKSNLKYPSFPGSQQVIGTNWEIFAQVLARIFSQQMPGLSNRCRVAFFHLTGWEIHYCYWLRAEYVLPSPFGEIVWHISTQVHNDLLAA